MPELKQVKNKEESCENCMLVDIDIDIKEFAKWIFHKESCKCQQKCMLHKCDIQNTDLGNVNRTYLSCSNFQKKITITAIDTAGNIFPKEITFIIYKEEHRIIVEFSRIGYFFDDLLKDYPFTKDFCIDMCGRNHKGYEVIIKKEELNKLFNTIKNARIVDEVVVY